MFLLLVPSILFLHEIEHNYFEIRPLVVLHCLGGVYCVEEVGGGGGGGGGGCLLDGMVKRGKEIPTSKCDIYGRGGALMWRSKEHLL